MKFETRISNLIFYLLILFLPTQLGRHFWPNFSFVSGIRIDYLSPTIYLTDVFIIGLFVFWLIGKIRIKNKYEFIIHNSKFIILFSFTAFLIIGILLSKNQGVGWYGFLKLLEFIFLGFYTARKISKLRFDIVLLLFSMGIIFESFLSILQYFNQSSIGGIFYFFGERTFNSQTPGIANASINGELVLRPYGTFPHPNVLAGCLLIGMTLVLGRIMNQESRIRRGIFISSLLIGSASLVITMSRVVIVLWFIIVGFQGITYAIKKLRNAKPMIHNSSFVIRLLIVLATLSVVGSILMFPPLHSRFTSIRLSDESITQRGELVRSSFEMIKSNLVFGVGLNNFLVELPNVHKQSSNVFYLQPVHNIYLLILAQTGIVGVIFFLWFIFKTYQRIMNQELRIKDFSMIHNSLFIILLTSVLTLGMFDHYFLTLQQGQLLFSFILGLCWSKNKENRI